MKKPADLCVLTASRGMAGVLALIVALWAAPVFAQEPVNTIPDKLSYATAAVNPTIAAIKALQSEHKGCQLGRLALSEGIGNVTTIVIKALVHSPRPCLGCAADGMPSGHTMNSFIGASASGWAIGASFGIATGGLRMTAHRHTFAQVAAGAAIGIGSDVAGRLIHCP